MPDNLFASTQDERAVGPFDRRFGALIASYVGAETKVSPAEAAAALMAATRGGDVCLSLDSLAQRLEENGAARLSADELRSELEAWGAVGKPGEREPLILDGERLYLHRYWRYERTISEYLERVSRTVLPLADAEGFRRRLDAAFPPDDERNRDQRLAVFAALAKPFAAISGGPGSGKTTVAVVAAAIGIETGSFAPEDVLLTAPSGKAAARLQDAISSPPQFLRDAGLFADPLSLETSTIHRALGARRGRATTKKNAHDRIVRKFVVADEASMIDLPLLARLIGALRDDARLILLGDKDQLGAVESGRAFADVGLGAGVSRFSQAFAEAARAVGVEVESGGGAVSTIADGVVEARSARRFESETIERAVIALRDGDDERAISAITEGGDASTKPLPHPRGLERALEETAEYFSRLGAVADPAEALARLRKYVLLTPRRTGPYGSLALNRIIHRLIFNESPSETNRARAGTPVMIVANDYRLELFNGDLGVAARDPADARVKCFFDVGGAVRVVRLSALPPWEPAFALTVHKSQGSEYDAAELVLPDDERRTATRPIVYTALSRAKKRFRLWGAEETLRAALRVERTRESGLRDATRAIAEATE